MDFRKELPFLFCELGLCPKDNGAKKRTHSNSPKNGFGVRFTGSALVTPTPPGRQEKLNSRVAERPNLFVLRVRPLFARKLRYAPSKWRFYT